MDELPAPQDSARAWAALESWIRTQAGGAGLLERFAAQGEIDEDALIDWLRAHGATAPGEWRTQIAGHNYGDIIQAAHIGVLNVIQGPERRPDPTPESPVVRLPFGRNPQFVGRQDLLADLAGEGPGAATITNRHQTLAGLGGVGKTQLALEYAYRALDEKRVALAWWVRAEEQTYLLADLAELAEQFGLASAQMARPEAAQAALRFLRETRAPWLLVYDNAPDPAALHEWLPGGGPGQVLITSRQRSGWSGLGREVGVETFDSEIATQLLLKRTSPPRQDEEAARTLAVRLGGHALALVQAAAYLSATGRSFGDYLTRLERDGRLLDRPIETIEYAGAVAAVMAASRAQAEQRSPAAGELLDLAAYLDPERIPLWLLQADGTNPGFGAEQLDDALSALAAFSLVELAEGALSVHRLVQEITRATDRRGWGRVVQEALIARLPSDVGDPDTWRLWAELAPHAIAAAHASGGAYPENAAWLLRQVARYVAARGDPRAAVTHFRGALALLLRISSDHPGVLTVKAGLATALLAAGNLSEARDLGVEVVAARELLLGREHPDTLSSLNDLAEILRALGDYTGVQRIQQQVLDAHGRTPDVNPLDRLTSMHNFAETLRAQGDPITARTMHEEVLEERRRLLGEHDRATLASMNTLASTLHALGEFEAALELRERVLAGTRLVLGEDHPTTLISMGNLAGTLEAMGDLSRAAQLREEALGGFRRALGEDHPDTLVSMGNLAENRRRRGDLDGACRLHQQVLAARQRVLGDEHPSTLISLGNLAAVLYEQGDLPDARQLEEQVLSVRRRVLGESHPGTRMAMENLAKTLMAQGDWDSFQELQMQILRVKASDLGGSGPAPPR